MRTIHRPVIAILLILSALLPTAAVAFADQQTPVAASASPAQQLVVTGTGNLGLVLRTDADPNSPALAVLDEGTSVVLLDGPISDGETDWYNVQTTGENALSGYSDAAYLQSAAPSAAQAAATTQTTASSTSSAAAIVASVTAYASGAGGGSVGTRTSSGTVPHWGTVAADIRLYPYGTRLTIDGYPGVVFVVEDTGSGVHGNIFDVWFPDIRSAVAFGTQQRKVTILSSSP